MDAPKTLSDCVLCYVSVLFGSAAVALPWALSRPLADVVADYTHAYFNGKPLPLFTDFLLALRPYCLVGALVLLILLLLSGGSLVRLSRQPVRSSLVFLLFSVVLASVSFAFVCVSLVIPFVRLFSVAHPP